MVELNLLPWREQRLRYEQQKKRLYLVLGALFGCVVWLSAHYILMQKTDKVRYQVQQLHSNLPQQTQHVLPPESAILRPQQLLDLFKQATQLVELGICYRSMQYAKQNLQLSGEAWSVSAIMASMKKLKAPPGFSVYGIKQLGQGQHYPALQFVMHTHKLTT